MKVQRCVLATYVCVEQASDACAHVFMIECVCMSVYLCCVTDCVHEQEVVVELCWAVLGHHGALQHLANLLRLTLQHCGLDGTSTTTTVTAVTATWAAGSVLVVASTCTCTNSNRYCSA